MEKLRFSGATTEVAARQMKTICRCVPPRRDIDQIVVTSTTTPRDLIRAGHSLGCANCAVEFARQFSGRRGA